MQRKNIRCCHCGKYTPFVTEESIEIIPTVNLTMTDMNALNALAEQSAGAGCFGLANFLKHIQSEVTKIIDYQEEGTVK